MFLPRPSGDVRRLLLSIPLVLPADQLGSKHQSVKEEVIVQDTPAWFRARATGIFTRLSSFA
ncbi:MAG: hypothetical protein CL878_10545 [Dehalococcoidia bacterium]|nr:hypothetical protein [Dehalococcoidia bacterium]